MQDLTPARRNADKELGMYDTVSGNFLTNSGTGAFTAGADNLAGLATVTFDGIDCPVTGYNAATKELYCQVPRATSSGQKEVVVTTHDDGQTHTGSYTYLPPTISSVTPSSGPTIGGQQIQISGDNLEAPAIPVTYTSIEYINFTGTQYINTGVDQLNSPKVVVDFKADVLTSQQNYPTVVGARGSSTAPYPGASEIRTGSVATSNFGGLYNAVGTNSVTELSLGTADSNRHIIETGYVGSTVTSKLDGHAFTAQQTIPTVARNYYIGTTNIGGTVSNNTHMYKGKVFGVQMYKNDVLVRDFQPVRRASDNVLGLYDRANGVFYANNGTGTFGVGATLPVNAYLGTVTVGGAPCTSPTIAGDVITCTTSSHTKGKVDVAVFNGVETVTATEGYEYTMSIDAITPNKGPTAGGQTVTITGTNLATKAVSSAYVPIEYINFTGTQYINTGVDQLNNPKVVVDFQVNDSVTQQPSATVIGARSGNAPPYAGSLHITVQSSLYIGTYYNISGTNALTLLNFGTFNGNRHVAEMGYVDTLVTAKLDDETKTGIQTKPVVASNYSIGSLNMANNGATGNHYYQGRVYGARMYKNDVLVRDFQPVRRASDNVLGLYDRANGVFYANNGTGTFGAGATLPVNAYLGTVTVGGAPCANPTIAGDVITCTTSTHTKGKVDVAVFNGVETVTSTNGYEYIMAVDTVTPSVGPIEGGQAVTITGENLQTPATGYTAVDYLNFTGTQYIDTGVDQMNNPKITVDFQPNATGQVGYVGVFGVYGTNTNPWPGGSAFRIATPDGNSFQYTYNNMSTGAHAATYFKPNTGERSKFEMSRKDESLSLNLDGDTRTFQQMIPSATYATNYSLGAVNAAGTIGTMYRGKIFSMQMYKNGTLVRDFQPARRNSDNVLGMYDKQNKVFYANNGTGTFGAGAVKSDAYMGVVKLGGSVCSDPRLVSSSVITCTSGSSTAGVYDVTVNNTVDTATLPGGYEYRADNFLQSLTSDKGTLSPSFDRDVMDYTLTLPASEPCVTIGAVTSDTSATVVGTGEQCRKGGETIVVTVTAANGETRDYTLTVVRPASDDATLADLQVDGATITGYDPATKTYEMEISDHRVREVEIGYEKGHHYQTTAPDSGYAVAIEPGTTATDVTVTSEDGSKTSTYTIVFSQPHTSKLMSLASDGSLTPAFDPDTPNYTMSVFDSVVGVNVNAVPFDRDAAVTVTGAAYIPASGGIVTVKVSREGVEDSIYTINVTKASADIQTVYNPPFLRGLATGRRFGGEYEGNYVPLIVQ